MQPAEALRSLAKPPPAASSSPAARTDRVVVTWSAKLGSGAAKEQGRLERLTRASGRNVRFQRLLEPGRAVYSLGRPLGGDAAGIVERIMALPGVDRVEPDLWVTADVLPDDTFAAELWGLLGVADGSSFGIDALGAWGTTRGAGITVAVIDTGIVPHPDLAGRIVPGWDMVSDVATANDGDGRDADGTDPGDHGCGRNSSWHGTHVAGTIVAIAGNATGVFGGAPDARVQSVRALGVCGGYASDIGDAIRWAVGGAVAGAGANATPARVLNLSLGGDGACPSFVEAAVIEARAAGAVVVVAAGNANSDAGTFFPANCPGVLTVAAVGQTGVRASFSNFGPDVDVAGPGVGIKSTVDTGATTAEGPTYANYNGTSMATPHVAATAALIAAAYPSLDPAAIEATIRITAAPYAVDPSTTGCSAIGCGSGIADAAAAVVGLDGAAPRVGSLTITPRYASSGFIDVVASAVDVDGIASAEVKLGAGAFTAMAAADGAYGADSEELVQRLSLPLSDGVLAVCIRARDVATNVSGTVCSDVTVDRVAPGVATPVLTPGSVGAGTPAQVAAQATDASGIQFGDVRVDGGPWEPIAVSPVGGLSATLATRIDDPASAISAGLYHACALATGGTVQCWGYNGVGQLGDGSTVDRTIPTSVSGLSGAIAISAGGYHTCAVLSAGTVRCWGSNTAGQLGDGTLTDRNVPTSVPGLSGVVAIAAGGFHTCARLGDGTVRCWGYNGFGGLGNGSTVDTSVPVVVSGAGGVTDLVAGAYHTCVLRSAAAPMCWGYNAYAQVGDGTQTDRLVPVALTGVDAATQLSAGILHTCARVAGGTVRCWGSNLDGAIGTFTPAATCPDVLCARLPTAVPGLTGVTQVITGGYFSCAVRADSTMRCWGDNLLGSLGDGTDELRPDPTPVIDLSGVTAATGGRFHACALLADGRARCWGLGLNGQLGNGEPGIWTAPASVVGLNGPLTAGPHQACARATDAAGNMSAGTACATLTVTDASIPIVRILAAQRDSPVGGGSLDYVLAFDAPVTGLTPADVAIAGSSTGWTVASITGSGATYAVHLSGSSATSGTLAVSLKSGSVFSGPAGPAVAFNAPSVTIDHTVPTTTTPTATPASVGAAASTISASANDVNGIEGMDLRLDGGSWIAMAAVDGAYGEAQEAGSLSVNDPIVSLAAGARHSCAALASGAVRCWGSNAEGQLGDGTLTDRSIPNPVAGIASAVAVVAGERHSCALLADRSVRCWGQPTNGGSAIGDGTNAQRRTPTPVLGITTATAITAGAFHTCAALLNGSASCWGANDTRQLGDGTAIGRLAPVAVLGVTGVAAVTAGGVHSCALRTNGTIRCWGLNDLGALGDGTTTARTGAVTVVAASGSANALSGVVAVDAGIYSTCAVLTTGSVRCWGFENSGVLGNGGDDIPTSAPVAVLGISSAIAVNVGGTGLGGYAHACATLADSSLRCWGFANSGQLGDGGYTNRASPVAVVGLSRIVLVSAGANHTCAALDDGRALCWGADLDGRLGDGTMTARSIATPVATLTGATAIASGGVRTHVDLGGPGHACARLIGGTARCWGANDVGQLGDGTTTTRPTPVAVPGLGGVLALTTGHGHTCAVLTSGAVRCWGGNSAGQLGDGTTANRRSPVTVSGITTATAVAAGPGVWWAGDMRSDDPSSTCARLSGGIVRCWGDNGFGQLGDGTLETRLTPVSVLGISTATAIGKSHTHSCAVLADTTVRCWGLNDYGQLGDGTLTNRVTPVAVRSGPGNAAPLVGAVRVVAGSAHTCVEMQDATVRCWGLNMMGQLGDATFITRRTPVSPLGIGRVTDLSAGQRHTCAIVLDGTARCWGEPDFGKLGAPPSIWSTAVPQVVFALHGATDIAASTVNTCAVVADGTASCWGDNRFGQIGDGTTADRSTPQAVLGLTGSLPAGAHQACVRVRDRAGNMSAGTACTSLTVTDGVPPKVLAFGPTTPSPTGGLSVSYALSFSEPVTGLSASDVVVSGASGPWTASTSGSGTSFTVMLSATDPSNGDLILTLKAGAVSDGAGNAGPSAARVATTVTILPFTDIATSTFRDDIVWLSEQAITTGCGVRLYCPTNEITRGQMATFLVNALSLPATTTDYFDDDDGTGYESNINRLAAAAITTGCGPRRYCPAESIDRAEMASFLARAYELPSTGTDFFVDDQGTTHETNINRLAAAAITTGCSATTYCPSELVTRGQMAAFVHRAANLSP